MAILANLSSLALAVIAPGLPATSALPPDTAALAGEPNYHGGMAEPAAKASGPRQEARPVAISATGGDAAQTLTLAPNEADGERILATCLKNHRTLWKTPNPSELISGMPAFCRMPASRASVASGGPSDAPLQMEPREMALQEKSAHDFF